MASLKRKRLSPYGKYKAITEVRSGTKPSKVAEKYGIPRNTVLKWLPGNKKKLKMLFKLVRLAQKRKNVRVRQNENLEKVLFDWFKRIRMNNLPVSGIILK